MLLPHHACVSYVSSVAFNTVDFPYIQNSSDVIYRQIDTVGIGDVAEMKQYAMRNPVAQEVVTIAVECNKMTVQAQNALLKILEDPPVKTQFIFFITSKNILIPTVHSRLHDVTYFLRSTYLDKSRTENKDVDYENFKHFISGEYKERLSFIESLVKSEKIDNFIEFIKSNYELCIQSTDDKKVLMFVFEHIYQPGASKKMLLEYLAVQLPVERRL